MVAWRRARLSPRFSVCKACSDAPQPSSRTRLDGRRMEPAAWAVRADPRHSGGGARQGAQARSAGRAGFDRRRDRRGSGRRAAVCHRLRDNLAKRRARLWPRARRAVFRGPDAGLSGFFSGRGDALSRARRRFDGCRRSARFLPLQRGASGAGRLYAANPAGGDPRRASRRLSRRAPHRRRSRHGRGAGRGDENGGDARLAPRR